MHKSLYCKILWLWHKGHGARWVSDILDPVAHRVGYTKGRPLPCLPQACESVNCALRLCLLYTQLLTLIVKKMFALLHSWKTTLKTFWWIAVNVQWLWMSEMQILILGHCWLVAVKLYLQTCSAVHFWTVKWFITSDLMTLLRPTRLAWLNEH